ncbi:MAG TPA: glutamate--tRNA ligase [Terracidiphilus sp.]|jgi:nondiscriminating glutamyl-tRNA synthetase|nr:glutamate--tRNA ligase [Terracidiphilus sp.]
MENGKIRVRFAPSPTGLLHVGNARTALYNWLFARRHGGTLILRIEDTDEERSEERYASQLMRDLRWLGLNWDEGPGEPGAANEENGAGRGEHGPYRQSERLEIYEKCTQQLLTEGKAYRCFCSAAELEAERKLYASRNMPQVYSGRCRDLSGRLMQKNIDAGLPFAVRLKIGEEPLKFHDLVRGDVEFPAEAVSDPILVRSRRHGKPGVPVYNYVVTVDDALMEITHVIRGDDHISNTPKQVAIYRAFGWKVPEFAHLSTILGSDRERLSKRHGATSIASFREMGYLPEALVNYLALLGWGAEDGKSETFTLPELVQAFELERVTASPAVFDFDKLNWLNRHSLKSCPPARLASIAWGYFGGLLPDKSTVTNAMLIWFVRVVHLFAPAVDHLDQLAAKCLFIFGFDPDHARHKDDNALILAEDSARIVLAELATHTRAHLDAVTPEIFKMWLDDIKSATGIHGKDLFHPVRIALTGSHAGPEFDKLIPLIEEGAALGLKIPSVRDRVDRFVGV